MQHMDGQRATSAVFRSHKQGSEIPMFRVPTISANPNQRSEAPPIRCRSTHDSTFVWTLLKHQDVALRLNLGPHQSNTSQTGPLAVQLGTWKGTRNNVRYRCRQKDLTSLLNETLHNYSDQTECCVGNVA